MKAALALVGGICCYALAYLFFRYLPGCLARWYGFSLHAQAEFAITALGLVAVTASGYRTWKTRGGLQSYHESALYHDFGDDNGGAFLVDHYLHRITGPAHVVSQIFLAGPVCLLNVPTLLASLIPHSGDLEAKLGRTLDLLRSARKWQPITDYPAMKSEILYLARMGLIDFSTAKDVPRIKAHVSDGT